jgi:hypothetical protein
VTVLYKLTNDKYNWNVDLKMRITHLKVKVRRWLHLNGESINAYSDGTAFLQNIRVLFGIYHIFQVSMVTMKVKVLIHIKSLGHLIFKNFDLIDYFVNIISLVNLILGFQNSFFINAWIDLFSQNVNIIYGLKFV